MKVKYDKEADVLYIEIRDTSVTTKRLDQDIAVDYDVDGEIAGIEVLSASKRLRQKEMPLKIILENVVVG